MLSPQAHIDTLQANIYTITMLSSVKKKTELSVNQRGDHSSERLGNLTPLARQTPSLPWQQPGARGLERNDEFLAASARGDGSGCMRGNKSYFSISEKNKNLSEVKHRLDNGDKKTQTTEVKHHVMLILHTAWSEYSEVETRRHLVDNQAAVQESE